MAVAMESIEMTTAWDEAEEKATDVPGVSALEDTAVQYMRSVSRCSDLLTREEEVELAKRIERGDEAARRQLAQANLRLVISIARRYAGRGANFMDLVQEGNIGMMRAIDKFNYRLGYKFSTYASWWIKQAVFQAFSDHDRPIRLPGHVIDGLSKLRQAQQQLKEKLGVEPTDEQLAQTMKLSLRKVQQLLRVSQRVLSLESEQIMKDGNSQPLIETIEDDRQDDVEGMLHKRKALQMLQLAFVSQLDGREQDILKKRFGFEADCSDKKMTLEAIGSMYGVTRETIRQTEMKALAKLRQSEFLKQLLD